MWSVAISFRLGMGRPDPSPDPTSRGWMGSGAMRPASFGVVALLSFGVAVYALVVYSMLPLGATVQPEIRASFEAHRVGIYAHVFGAAFALLLGPLQFIARLRSARPKLHRFIGRAYLGLGVGVGGIAGLYMAFFAYGGLVSSAGFALLALAWLYTGARAYGAARARRFAEHRGWMVRNFSLALAAVTLRIYVGIAVAAGLPFEAVYPVLAWISWVPNILLAEFMVRREARSA